MTDIATTIITNQYASSCDWAIDADTADLLADGGLKTAVTISLLSDRLANADDFIPDAPAPGQAGTIADRRGWWADTIPVPGGTQGQKKDLTGSRLWLLVRGKAMQQTATLARQYVKEALQWMIDDGVAQRISVAAKLNNVGNLLMGIAIQRTVANGQPVNHAYDLVWAVTEGIIGTIDQMVLHETLVTDTGQAITDEAGRPIYVT